MTIHELKYTNKSFFGYFPKVIRNKEMKIILSKCKNQIDPKLFAKLFYGLRVDTEYGCWTEEDWSWYRKITFDKQVMLTHRLSYYILRAQIKPGMYVCHYCDRKGCCNPFHLFQGTQQDNMDDYKVKYRKPTVWVEKELQKDGTILYKAHPIKN